MWNAFTKLAQANVDHFNNHPIRHKTAIVVYGAVAVAAANKALNKLVENPR